MLQRKKYKLEAEKVNPFLGNNLKNTNTLSDFTYEFLKKQKSGYKTFLADGILEEQIYKFKQGGVGSGEREHLEKFINKEMTKHSSLSCIFDNVSLDYKPHLSEQTFTAYGSHFEKEIYYIVSSKDVMQHGDLLKRCLYLNDGIWHSLCILFDQKKVGNIDKKLSRETLHNIVQSSYFIMLRAYDQEGYIIWTNK